MWEVIEGILTRSLKQNTTEAGKNASFGLKASLTRRGSLIRNVFSYVSASNIPYPVIDADVIRVSGHSSLIE